MALESLQPGDGLDYALLEGKWRLVYTTAADVVPIVGLDLSRLLPAGLPAPVVVGDVFQRFSSVEEGRVENIIEFGLPPFTQDSRGITFTVGARCAGARPRGRGAGGCAVRGGAAAAVPAVPTPIAPAPRGAAAAGCRGGWATSWGLSQAAWKLCVASCA